jgi:hypothetical protein
MRIINSHWSIQLLLLLKHGSESNVNFLDMKLSDKSRDNSVDIEGWTAGVRFPEGSRDFSLMNSIQTGSEARPVFYPIGVRSSFLKGKDAGA